MDEIYLRLWFTQSDYIIPGAKVRAGQGLVGLLVKEGVGRILEHDIVTNSTQLQYYSDNEKVKSIAGVPIMVKGVRRGAVVVDSLERRAFNQEDISILENFASLIGQFMYYAYLNHENSRQRDQLAALTNYQRKFLENMSEDEIVKYVQQYIEQSLEADRIMTLARATDNQSTAKVLSCKGLDSKYFKDFRFALSEKGLVSLVFEKEQIINRSFNRSERIPRLSTRERFNDSIKSLLAVPVRTDIGISHALMVESTRRTWFSNHQKEMLLTISRAAGFALSRARLYKEKEQLARSDGLTGLINHKTFQEQYKNEILRAKREGYSLAILMLDLDYFKQVNDKYGHPAGDIVLRETAKIMEQGIRAGSDTVARYGGEEFVCILINSSLKEARETAERIRQSIKNKVFNVGSVEKLRVTISIGGAMYPSDSKYGKKILEKADKSLYHAKKTGRDRVVFFSD
jgi:diguanylate cyclase (GGDEF)-like protein